MCKERDRLMSVAFFPRTSAVGKIIIKESLMNNKYVHTPRKNALGIRKMVLLSERKKALMVSSDCVGND